MVGRVVLPALAVAIRHSRTLAGLSAVLAGTRVLMPMTTKKGKPNKRALPGTVARSGKKARRTFAHAHDSALQEYGNEKQARKVAYAALKQTHRKSGDRWKKRKAQDDAGVGMDWSKAALYDAATELDIGGRSTMSKRDLVQAIRAHAGSR